LRQWRCCPWRLRRWYHQCVVCARRWGKSLLALRARCRRGTGFLPGRILGLKTVLDVYIFWVIGSLLVFSLFKHFQRHPSKYLRNYSAHFLPPKYLQNLGLVVPCIFKYSNKTPTQMHQSIVTFIVSSHRRRSTCFGHQELFQTAVAASGCRVNAEVVVFPAVVGL
jgi:hypothetical protein